jgi:hypothetical protein
VRLIVCLFIAGCGSQGGARADGGDAVTLGEMFVLERGCPTCHQSPNAGDGLLSGRTMPIMGTMSYPKNLTPDKDTGIGDWTDDDIKRAMRSGIDDEGVTLCPPMPHFDGTGGDGRPMDEDEADSIIAYLRSLPAVHREIPESVCAQKDMAQIVDLSMPDRD